MVWILIGIFALIMILELPGLLKQKWYLETTVFMVLLVIGIYMGLAFFYDWQLVKLFEDMNAYILGGTHV